MTLASLAANGDFRQWSLRIFGNPEASREAGNLGTAMLFEAVSARAGRLSSAAAENPKDHCRPPQAENRPERETCQWHLDYQHCVAVAVKPVFLFQRFIIRLLEQFLASEGADEHKKRGPGQMKIRQQSADQLKFITRINE